MVDDVTDGVSDITNDVVGGTDAENDTTVTDGKTTDDKSTATPSPSPANKKK